MLRTMHVGQKIKSRVENSKDFNHKEFAALIGHTEQSLHGIYKKESIQVDLLELICNKLNISISEFLEDKKQNVADLWFPMVKKARN